MAALRRTPMAATLIGPLLLSACSVVPAGGRGGYGAYSGAAVALAPPPLQAELVGVAPGQGHFWINGYWNWFGGRHAWVGGRWEAHRPGHQWQPHRWHQEGQGWRAEQGRWNRH